MPKSQHKASFGFKETLFGIVTLLLTDSISQFHNECITHRNNSQIARNCLLCFGVELLTFAANYANGRKTDIFSSRGQLAIADLITVASDMERTIFLPVAR